ncbi:hypothetical protein D3C80_1268340 [compost metagenome]
MPAAPADDGSRWSSASTFVMPVRSMSSPDTTVAGPTPLMSWRLIRLPVTTISSTLVVAASWAEADMPHMVAVITAPANKSLLFMRFMIIPLAFRPRRTGPAPPRSRPRLGEVKSCIYI